MKDATFSSARLLALYDRISDAEDAVPRLRSFVLNLAVRGKLVEQDASEEPAVELLKRIAAERKRRIEIGELKKAKGLPAPKLADHLFKVPRTWIWTVADHVWDFENGDRGKNYPSRDQLVDNGIPFVNAGHLVDGRVNMSEMNFVTPEKFQQISGGKLRKGDQIYCLRGSLGKHAVFDLETDAAIASSLVILRPVVPDCVPFLSLFLDSDIAVVLLRRFDNGSAQPNLSSANLRKYDVPLPPLAEQHRIVAKVDELMALCDQLEQARAGREAVRDRLTTATLSRLTAPDTDAETFQSHARFALHSLPTLTTRPDQIKILRQTILNLAVRGKLVPQDAADEPAAKLLKRVVQEISVYSKSNRIGLTLPSPVSTEEKLFAVPDGWQWTRLCGLFNVITDGDHQPPPKADEGVAFLTIGNVTTGKLNFDGCRIVPRAYYEGLAPYRTPAKGDILYTVVGATYGRPALVDADRAFCVQRHIAIMKPSTALNLKFLLILLGSPMIYDQATKGTTGTAQPTIALRPLRNFVAALPPLAEQHRIVTRVDALMALCDQLEASLTTTATTRRTLLEALLHEALEPAAEELEVVQ
jgi:type I restriction enzyme, S subunit